MAAALTLVVQAQSWGVTSTLKKLLWPHLLWDWLAGLNFVMAQAAPVWVTAKGWPPIWTVPFLGCDVAVFGTTILMVPLFFTQAEGVVDIQPGAVIAGEGQIV
jgi:hypothetical protein